MSADPRLPHYLRIVQPPEPEQLPLQVYLLTLELAEIRARMAQIATLFQLPTGDPADWHE